MAFWNRKKRPAREIDQSVLVRGRKGLAVGGDVWRQEHNRRPRRLWEPRALGRVVGGPLAGVQSSFAYSGGNRGDFYRWMRDSIPIISAGVWAWVRLCATPTTTIVSGSAAERLRAETALKRLDRRILEAPYGRGSGFEKLTEASFLELFTTGRFAGEAVLAEDCRSIDHFRFLDPHRVGWDHTPDGWRPYFLSPESDGTKEEAVEKPNPKTFFYATLGTDLNNPGGVEPLASIPFVTEIEELMLEDMARSAHNAGVPRLQVKVGRPERFSWEGDVEYADRANRFFEQLVSQFGRLEPDDNIFTWSDVEVAIVGGSGRQWEWRLNRDQVVEDVITGLKLYPWVLGRTHKTTQNWVQSQFDLLMQMVASHQKSGADLIQWLANLELELQGIDATVEHLFGKHPDPFRLDRAQAEKLEFENIDAKVQRGYISHEEAVRLLGLATSS